MRPSKQEMRKRADAADEKLRLVARRADAVREGAFNRISAKLPVARLDLYGTPPTTFHAVIYFERTSEVPAFDNAATRAIVETEIKAALPDVDPDADEPEIRIDIDSIERMEATGEGYFAKFR